MRSRILAGALLVIIAVAGQAIANERYDPRLRFRTLSTRHFDIHFHQGEENLAHLLGGTAESVAKEMEPRLGRPQGRVQVILVNQTDLSNGWATPTPYNLIEIVAATPRSDSLIGNTSDWLRLVFTHEYTHVLHLERSRGWFSSARRVFGRVPILFPNLFLPPPLIEGIATYAESAVTHEGRIPAGDFRLVKDRAAGAGRFPSLPDVSNARVEWPSGHTQYVYGGYFHDYLAKTYGEQSLERLADETSGRIPYLGVRAFRQVYGKTLGQLWKDFEKASTSTSTTASTSTAKRLTHHGFTVSSPWFSPDGRLFYSISNPHGFPALMEMTSAGPRRVTTRVGGGRIGGNTREVVFDQLDYVRSVGLQSDLYAADMSTGTVRRITKNNRASDPHVSPDGSTIVCVVQSDGGRGLATLRLEPPPLQNVATARLEGGFYDYASPRWSPDGQTIAVEFSGLDLPTSIVIVDGKTLQFVRRVAAFADGRSASPAWSPDGRTLYYAASRQGAPFQIHAFDLAASSTRVLRNAGSSAQSPAISPDGKTIVFTGYTEAGYDLFSLPVSEAIWEPVAGDVVSPKSDPRAPRVPATPLPTQTYNPLSTLAPRFWAPVVEPDDDELSVGAATGGFDALGRHYYLGTLTWSTRVRPDWVAYYAYDRWRPTLFADVADDTDPWRDGQLRVVEANVGARLRVRTVRRSQLFYGAFHGASETFDCPTCPTPVDVTIDRRALRAAWVIDTSRRYGYSVSEEYGLLFSASSEWTRKALGSTGDAGAAIADGRGYLPLGPRHAALAVRGAAASAWGDPSVRRVFAAGGSGAQPGGIDFDFDAIALVRGFETSDVSGRHAAVLNADYRFPIRWLERGVGTWPVFARSLHGAIFTDVGAAWSSQFSRSDRRASFGGELSADLVVGYAIPITVTAGAAWRDDPSGQSNGAALFVRLGRAF